MAELPRRRAFRDAAETLLHLEALVNSSDDAIISKTLDGVIVTWNRGAQQLFGYSSDATVGKSISMLVPPDRLDELDGILASVRRGEHIQPLETRRVTSDGHVIDVSLRVSLIYNAAGEVTGASSIARDISDRKRADLILQHAVDHDELTGLHNRRGFVTLADHQLAVEARRRRRLPLLFIDIDGMKAINDLYGHAEGDRTLVEVAKFLRTILRASDVVARLGGDEFCILLIDDGTATETDVERVVALVRSGPPRGQRPYALSMSVGVAWLEPGSGTTVEQLMSKADSAMYQDKRSQHRLARGSEVDAAGLRDETADRRDRMADERDDTAVQRDHTADERDQTADERDQAGHRRDQAAYKRDLTDKRSEAALGAGITADALTRSSVARRKAASDRREALEDRRSGASERSEAEDDRVSALADREAGADERAEAGRDRISALADRDAKLD